MFLATRGVAATGSGAHTLPSRPCQLPAQFMLANGKLVRVLLHTDVVKYLEFKASVARVLH